MCSACHEVDIWAHGDCPIQNATAASGFFRIIHRQKIFGRVGQRTDARKIFVF
jgi:hypothetical protein